MERLFVLLSQYPMSHNQVFNCSSILPLGLTLCGHFKSFNFIVYLAQHILNFPQKVEIDNINNASTGFISRRKGEVYSMTPQHLCFYILIYLYLFLSLGVNQPCLLFHFNFNDFLFEDDEKRNTSEKHTCRSRLVARL